MVSLHPQLRLILNSSIIFTISLVVTVLLYYISTMLLKLPLLHTSDRMMHRIKKNQHTMQTKLQPNKERGPVRTIRKGQRGRTKMKLAILISFTCRLNILEIYGKRVLMKDI